MGAGIATAMLLAGLDVTLVERDTGARDKARETIAGNLAAAVGRGQARRGPARGDPHRTPPHARRVTTPLAEVDLVVEAVFEELELKREVFASLDGIVRDGAILATNTSYLDVNAIAGATSRPADVLGLHFFSPAHVMRLLEIVVADATAPEVVASAFALAKRLGKVAVPAGRLRRLHRQPSLGALPRSRRSHGTRRREPVRDRCGDPGRSASRWGRTRCSTSPVSTSPMRPGSGRPPGVTRASACRPSPTPSSRPADWARRAGAATTSTRRARAAAHPIRAWREDRRRGARRRRASCRGAFDDEEIVRRYLAAMIDEGARVVDEGIARRPHDVDVVLAHGYGFPRWRGAADEARRHDRTRSGARGHPRVRRRRRSLLGAGTPLLERLVDAGRTFEAMNAEGAGRGERRRRHPAALSRAERAHLPGRGRLPRRLQRLLACTAPRCGVPLARALADVGDRSATRSRPVRRRVGGDGTPGSRCPPRGSAPSACTNCPAATPTSGARSAKRTR